MADFMKNALQLVQQLQQLHQAGNWDQAYQLLSPIKLMLVQCTVGPGEESKLALLTREALELAAIVCAQLQDADGFERNVLQLKSFYFQSGSSIPTSERQFPIVGLHLTFLLAMNRIAEFHVRLCVRTGL